MTLYVWKNMKMIKKALTDPSLCSIMYIEREVNKMTCENCKYLGYGETEEERICTNVCGPIGKINPTENFIECSEYEVEKVR